MKQNYLHEILALEDSQKDELAVAFEKKNASTHLVLGSISPCQLLSTIYDLTYVYF